MDPPRWAHNDPVPGPEPHTLSRTPHAHAHAHAHMHASPCTGKSFFKKSKQPAAVDLTRKNVREALRQAVEGTRFLPPSGTLVSLLVGFSAQPQVTSSGHTRPREVTRSQRPPRRWPSSAAAPPHTPSRPLTAQLGGSGRLGAAGGSGHWAPSRGLGRLKLRWPIQPPFGHPGPFGCQRAGGGEAGRPQAEG